MRRIRFSIGGLMGFVVVAALGIGGLKASNEFWASASFTLIIVGLVLAIFHAMQGRGKDRAYWVGFAIAGWTYFAVAFGSVGPFRVTCPPLLVELLFDRLEPVFHPTGFTEVIAFTARPRSVLRLPPRRWPLVPVPRPRHLARPC